VKVSPATVASGSSDTLTFLCPNERRSGAITKLIVQLPQDAPLARVDVRPVSGWHASVAMRTLAQPMRGPNGTVTRVADTIAWTGGTIAPGARATFAIVAGPMPSAGRALAFKALQFYSNGDVVRWIDLRNPGEAEPANPAPVVRVR
jgi:uncharacterized protein